MRTRVVMLALALIVPVSAAAQAQTPAPPHADRRTFVPQHKQTLSIDFGVKKAAAILREAPVRCDSVKKHRHEVLPAGKGLVELPLVHPGRHRLISAPVSPCPVR